MIRKLLYNSSVHSKALLAHEISLFLVNSSKFGKNIEELVQLVKSLTMLTVSTGSHEEVFFLNFRYKLTAFAWAKDKDITAH